MLTRRVFSCNHCINSNKSSSLLLTSTTSPLRFCSSSSSSSSTKNDEPSQQADQQKKKVKKGHFTRRLELEREFHQPTPGTIVQPSPISGSPDMTVIDWQDVELDKKEAAETGDETKAKLAERRKAEQSAILSERMRHVRMEKTAMYLFVFASFGMLAYVVPHFVRSFRSLMRDRNAKDAFGPPEKPEDYDEKTGLSPTLDAKHPRILRADGSVAAGGSSTVSSWLGAKNQRESFDSTDSSFLNKQSAFGTARFKKKSEEEVLAHMNKQR